MASGTGPAPHAPRIVQDLPPPGGYPPIRTAPYFPRHGFSGPVILAGLSVMTVWGLFRVGAHNKHRSELRREQREAHRNLLPLLQAEADREYIRERKVKLLLEAEVMKEFKDWKVGENVYQTVDWMPPMAMPEQILFPDPLHVAR